MKKETHADKQSVDEKKSKKNEERGRDDPLISFLVALGIPLSMLPSLIPYTATYLPITGSEAGQFGFLFMLGYLWREFKRLK